MKKYLEIFRTSNKALLLHKGRTALTMLGVIIGVFAVVSLVSLGVGVQNYIQDQFESIGANILFLVPGKVDFGDDPAKTYGNNKLDLRHIDNIEEEAADYVEAVSPYIIFGKNAAYKTNSYYATVSGVNYKAASMFNFDIGEGRFFSATEESNKAKVAVIGPLVKEELFKNSSPIGKKIEVDDNTYEVIGLTKEKGPDWDDNVLVPYTRAIDDFDVESITSIGIQAKDSDSIDLAAKQIKYALLKDLEEDEFSVISAKDILESIQNVLGIVTTAIGAIAGISLLVGGIGIMNIMLVSVTERIKEIGLRKAVGATPRDIALQFLTESVMISVGGGMIGLLFGVLAAQAARAFIRTSVPLWAVLLALGFSIFVGIIFGTYPAIKASKKDPIEALRYE